MRKHLVYANIFISFIYKKVFQCIFGKIENLARVTYCQCGKILGDCSSDYCCFVTSSVVHIFDYPLSKGKWFCESGIDHNIGWNLYGFYE